MVTATKTRVSGQVTPNIDVLPADASSVRREASVMSKSPLQSEERDRPFANRIGHNGTLHFVLD